VIAVEGAATFRSSAAIYDRHVGRYGPALAAGMVERAGMRAGMRALDVGCGTGMLTAALAERLGAAEVAAVDPSEPFVEACRQRVPGADVRRGSAERLPFDDRSFDAVLSQLVINFLSNVPTGLAEMRRVARRGAVIAACVWDYARGMTMLRTFWDAAVALDPEGAGELDEGRRMRYCTPDELRALWAQAGLEDIEVDELEVSAAYEDFDDFWAPFPTGVAPSGAYCASLEERRQERLREEVRRRLGSPKGAFELTARAWYATGRAAANAQATR
jgi:SAM-dependent methyltransferase